MLQLTECKFNATPSERKVKIKVAEWGQTAINKV